MDVPNPSENLGWISSVGAVLLFLLTIGGQAWGYIYEAKKKSDEKSKNDHPTHIAMEHSDLADMAPLRELVKTLVKLEPLIASIKADTSIVLVNSSEGIKILRQIEIDARVEEQVQSKLRDQLIRADRAEAARWNRSQQKQDD